MMIFRAVLARAFALNPVTWLIAGIVALVALVDDFITYLDGGESLLGAFWGPLITYAKRQGSMTAMRLLSTPCFSKPWFPKNRKKGIKLIL